MKWYKYTRNQDVTTIDVLFCCNESKPPHWFVPEKRAKVWTTITAIKHFTSYVKCKNIDMDNTFDEYEVIIDGKQAISLTQFLENA